MTNQPVSYSLMPLYFINYLLLIAQISLKPNWGGSEQPILCHASMNFCSSFFLYYSFWGGALKEAIRSGWW